MKVIRNHDNKLMKGRIIDEAAFDMFGTFQVRELTKGSKWQGACINDFREIKTRTIKCVYVDHANAIKKTFKVGSRYQIEQGRALGAVAGYVFDDDGDRWNLLREEVGFSAGSCYLFEALYK